MELPSSTLLHPKGPATAGPFVRSGLAGGAAPLRATRSARSTFPADALGSRTERDQPGLRRRLQQIARPGRRDAEEILHVAAADGAARTGERVDQADRLLSRSREVRQHRTERLTQLVGQAPGSLPAGTRAGSRLQHSIRDGLLDEACEFRFALLRLLHQLRERERRSTTEHVEGDSSARGALQARREASVRGDDFRDRIASSQNDAHAAVAFCEFGSSMPESDHVDVHPVDTGPLALGEPQRAQRVTEHSIPRGRRGGQYRLRCHAAIEPTRREDDDLVARVIDDDGPRDVPVAVHDRVDEHLTNDLFGYRVYGRTHRRAVSRQDDRAIRRGDRLQDGGQFLGQPAPRRLDADLTRCAGSRPAEILEPWAVGGSDQQRSCTVEATVGTDELEASQQICVGRVRQVVVTQLLRRAQEVAQRIDRGRPRGGGGKPAGARGPVVALPLLRPCHLLGERLHLLAAGPVASQTTRAAALGDRCDMRFGSVITRDDERQHTSSMALERFDGDAQRRPGQLVDPLHNPRDVDVSADPGIRARSFVVEAEQQDAALVVGETGELGDEVAGHLVASRHRWPDRTAGTSPPRLLFAVQRLGLDGVGDLARVDPVERRQRLAQSLVSRWLRETCGFHAINIHQLTRDWPVYVYTMFLAGFTPR